MTSRSTFGFSVPSDFGECDVPVSLPGSNPTATFCEPRSQRLGHWSGTSLAGDVDHASSFVGGINPSFQLDSGAGGVGPSITLPFRNNIHLAEITGVSPLAQGGFCVVCSCVYRGQRAVLKVPKAEEPQGTVADLLVEIDIYRRISARGGNVSIARAFGTGLHFQNGEQLPFLLLERLDGGTLADAIERIRPPGDVAWVDPRPRLPVALEIANALAFLHNDAIPGGFILHRDLKPTNIGLCAQGHVKVYDFGLSALQEVRGGRDNKYQMAGVAGSKRFMAPEVCNNLQYNEKADVYSFGIVMWEICALRKPFSGMGVADHYREVVVGGLRPHLDSRWPTVLNQLLNSCWHPDPDRRPSMVEARETLRELVAGRSGCAVQR